MFEEPKIHSPQAEDFTELQSADDLIFEEVKEGDTDFESAMQISVAKETSQEEIVDKIRKEMLRTHWWLHDVWQEKGIPVEQFSINIKDYVVELYNYGEPLSDGQLSEFSKTIETLGQISGDKPLYITINNEGEFNDQNSEEGRGFAHRPQDMIELLPRAMSESHRIPETSGFVGTLIHEFGHFLQQNPELQKEWTKRFGWKELDEKKPVGSTYTYFETDREDRCVTDYAKFSPDEDICESLVAAICNPSILDKEKLEFLKEKWLDSVMAREENRPDVKRKIDKEIQLPKCPTIIKYKVKLQKFAIDPTA